METPSLGGSKYILTLIDDFTRKVFVFFLKQKSKVSEVFAEFKASIERQTPKRIRILRTDNGKEYVNNKLRKNLKELGIRQQLTIPHTPGQNGVAERMNRTIVEKAMSMLFGAKLPKTYWAEAVSTAVYLINRSPTKAVTGKTPEEAWTGH